MSRFTRSGKQVLYYGEYFADAADDLGAMMIVNALRAIDDASSPTHCRRRKEGDEIACACGLRWAVDEDDPHLARSASSSR